MACFTLPFLVSFLSVLPLFPFEPILRKLVGLGRKQRGWAKPKKDMASND